MLQEIDDQTLIERILAGDQEEFRLLLRRYQNLIFSMIFRQVGNRDTAADLTQETFLRAYSGLPHFRFRSTFKTWLTRISLNVTATYFESRSYREERRTEALDTRDHSETDTGESPIEKERALNCLQSALSLLSPQFREVIVLCKLEGRSYTEAAEILQVAPGTVGSRLNSAQQELRKTFRRTYK